MTKRYSLHCYIFLLAIFLLHFNIVQAEKFHTAKLIPISNPPGVGASAIAAGDLNGDGKDDLVYTGTVVHILISNGDGTFQPETTLDPGMATGAVIIADVNGDGHADILAVGNGGTTNATVNVLLGNGDGTFQLPALTSVVAQSTFVFPAILGLGVGDFDGDGKLDLLASDAQNNLVSFSKGDGSGHFALQRSLSENGGPGQILVADLNHDGHLDFVVHSGLGADEQVFLGNGDGTFAAAVSYRGPDNVTGAALADIDGDGNLDLIISGFDNKVDILLGRADGTFSNVPATPGVLYGASAGGVFAAGDFNHDGRIDVAVFSRNGITVLLGAPGLTFTVSGTYAGTALPNPPTAGDFNGDGQTDFAISGAFDKQIAILLGKPDGTLNGAPAYDVGAAVNSVAVADLNEDGVLDMVVGTVRSTPSVLLGKGAGDFTLPNDPVLLLTGSGQGSVEVADFNGDGKPDVLVGNRGESPIIQLGNGNGTFQPPTPVTTNTAINTIVNCARSADVNNDGKIDVLVSTFVFTGNGDGTFVGPANAFTSGGVFGCLPVIADFNHDGKLDLAFGQASDLSVQLGNGDGTFGPVANTPLPNSVFDIAAGDFNGDGNVDLVATIGFTSSAAVLLGNGDGTFQAPILLSTGNHQEGNVAVGDVNGDGKQDLVFSDGFVITVMHGNGDGTFQPGVDYAAGTGANKPQLADLNGDGELDIAFANFDTNVASTVTVLLNQSGTAVSFTSSTSNSQFGQPVSFNSSVTPTVLDSDPPTGTTTITSDGATLSAGAVSAGKFGITTTTLPVGTHTIAGNYSGDSLYRPKALPAITETVVQANTGVTLSTSATPNLFGHPLTVKATVTPAFTGTPTGAVTFTDGGTVLGSLPLDVNSSATIDLSSLPAGTHHIVASYAGDADFKSSVSATLTQTVFFPTTISLTTNSAQQLANSPLNINVKVSSANGTPTGKVNILDGASVVSQVTLDPTGAATFSTTTLAGGTHSLTAAYAGDGFFNPVTSTAVTYDVADFSVSSTPASATISRGQSSTFSISVAPINGFTGSVSFACQGLPSFAQCTFNPSTLTPSGAPVATTLTVSTTAAGSALPVNMDWLIRLLLLAGLLSGFLAALYFTGSAVQWRLPSAAFRFAVLVLAVSGCMLMVSCGGGGSTPAPPPSTTTNVTVTSSATSGTVSDTHAVVLRITIQ